MSPEMEVLIKGQIGSIRLAIQNAQRRALERRETETVQALEMIAIELDYMEHYLFPPPTDEGPF